MKVESLHLKNFRNIRDSVFYPDRRVNFLVGPNGQGKTSYIEAIGFLSTLRSFRDSKITSVIQWEAQNSEITAVLSSDHEALTDQWRTELGVRFEWTDLTHQKATKAAVINGKPFKSSTQYLSQRFGSYELGFHSIIFNPSDHDLVRGDPNTRRNYLDRVIAAENIEYLKILQKYHRVLLQRNALLKSFESPSQTLLFGFTEALAHLGAQLTYQRLQWLYQLNQRVSETLFRIAPDQPKLRSVYFSSWAPEIENFSLNNNNLNSIHFTGQGHLPSLELLEQSFWVKASALELAERKAGHSLVGPHRDDWGFFLGDQILKGHGSQGEVRSALLALKLSEIELFRNKTGHRPLFLLDDFSSELDQKRRLFLLQFLMETDLQTFVTTTEDSSFVGKRFWVSHGTIEEGTNDDRKSAKQE